MTRGVDRASSKVRDLTTFSMLSGSIFANGGTTDANDAWLSTEEASIRESVATALPASGSRGVLGTVGITELDARAEGASIRELVATTLPASGSRGVLGSVGTTEEDLDARRADKLEAIGVVAPPSPWAVCACVVESDKAPCWGRSVRASDAGSAGDASSVAVKGPSSILLGMLGD
jgi:hypothetical protein